MAAKKKARKKPKAQIAAEEGLAHGQKMSRAQKEAEVQRFSDSIDSQAVLNQPTTEVIDGRKNNGSNLNGRPKGVKNKTTLFKEAMREGFEDKLMKEGMAVFDAVVSKAKEGDMTAAKMILDRIVPVSKAVDINATDISGKGGITIHIEKMVASTGKVDEVLIEDGEIVED